MDISDIKKAIENSWDAATCYPKCRNNRNKNNPSLWQCAITALIIQDYFWWELLFCLHANHYRNKLENWEEIDLTKDQFSKETRICKDKIVKRETILSWAPAVLAETEKRYTILKERTEKEIKLITS
jgi:hypothetical protein